ncbi:hypothetical protein [Nocardia bovistercoris]|uniref:Uncharacterized protein n=1 Tax=Nocardia bovistercoris TaxID=2785916 RepID=A0A931N1E8_9NOCA|nr:hypothetical protein [Nocardia bovistercoris]MBH0775894.1 hypothetical protein [Nocardia bovistercoris]
MNLVVVIGVVLFIAGVAVVVAGFLRRSGANHHLTVADIQARLASEEDLDTITDRAVGRTSASLRGPRPVTRPGAGISRPAIS